MAKNIHVIKDESLGGVEREYVEVDRKAEVGDKIVYAGEILTVTDSDRWDDGDGISVNGVDYGIFHWAYKTLEPTDIVNIAGERFRLVDRKAEVGEHILIDTDDVDFDNGSVMTVSDEDRWEDGSGISVNESRNGLYHEEYYVLVPVESELTAAEPPESLHDIIANLVRRVAQLESELTGAKRDIETWAQEVETLRYTNTELYSRLGHVEQDTDDLDEKVEMCIDDIVTLDERTNLSQEITISVAELTKLIGGAR